MQKKKIINTQGINFKTSRALQEKINIELFSAPSDQPFQLNITGSGHPFASPVFRDFLFSMDGSLFPNLEIKLQTNGVLLTPKNWQKMHQLHENISTLLVSFDAASESTYNITRRGGDWSLLQENMSRLAELRVAGKLRFLRLDFVVQQANYQEMEGFVELARKYHADKAAFSMVLDWNTWSLSEYQKQCIWKQDHSEFDEFISVLKNPIFDDPIVALGNLTEYRQLASNRLKEAV
ncbi:MAG: radical SAM protein [Gammaproteobacteria bacterium]|nr:radical SAM protein [Gammaproteobacteria bacterium]